MPSTILPSPEEIETLVPRPGSVVWQRAGDARAFLAAGYALTLQVAHPTVGAGVLEHSNYRADPWGRLLRTLDYVNSTVYGGPRLAGEVGSRVREMHKRIKGTKPDGTPYHALEPEAYAWVHATLAESIVAANQRFVRPMAPAEVEAFWRQWRPLGRLVGVRDGDLPETWGEFRVYFDRMVAERLENNEAVRDVLDTPNSAARPEIPLLGSRSWKALRIPAARLFDLATVGMMPPLLRNRLQRHWSSAAELEFRALSRAARTVHPLMPPQLRIIGPGYLRWRRQAIARGDVARLAPAA